LLAMEVLSECFRGLKKDGSMHMFTANRDNSYFMQKAEERRFVEELEASRYILTTS
jgi:hypothetical protein